MFAYACITLIFVAAGTAQAQNPSPNAVANNICVKRNSYYKVDGSCDTYVECVGYVGAKKACPDGLHYNPAAVWPQYPCGFPMDVPCVGRETLPAQATADCPHQYGFFKSPLASADNCGQFRECVGGVPIELSCPVGLAFNPDSGRCDWPDNVPSCNSDVFFKFTCPANRGSSYSNHKYEGNCYYFYSCILGSPRLLQCDPGLAFDPASARCVDEERVDCSSGAAAVASAPQ
ncbi:protein obstructor-E-like [Trichoplusia ni]|uniref:Protein obstructor-E-like n=1 Tax=Trichoplusia ni TaxID=7111 RepID=A0A7E5VGI6_TRINI|nr:protein obstructor-E-like [Trichoplusia ni]